MPLVDKIKALCAYNKLPISKLESTLGYSNGSLVKSGANSIRADRIRSIANFFDVTPTYLMSDMTFCVCPVCAVAYNPLDNKTVEMHKLMHNNYLELRDKIGYLLNPTEAATKRVIAEANLKDTSISDEGRIFHYETMVQCDFAEFAYFNNFIVDISYADFIKDEIRSRKYFEFIPVSVVKNLVVKYNVDMDGGAPLTSSFEHDKEFMANVTDLWDLPQDLRKDVYKAIRHAKRDYADREYYTNPYKSMDAKEGNT